MRVRATKRIVAPRLEFLCQEVNPVDEFIAAWKELHAIRSMVRAAEKLVDTPKNDVQMVASREASLVRALHRLRRASQP